jgi:hypothetical protein
MLNNVPTCPISVVVSEVSMGWEKRMEGNGVIPWPRTAANPCSSLQMGSIPVETQTRPAFVNK